MVRLNVLVMIIVCNIEICIWVLQSVGFDSLFVSLSFNEKDVHKCKNDNGEEFGLDGNCCDHIYFLWLSQVNILSKSISVLIFCMDISNVDVECCYGNVNNFCLSIYYTHLDINYLFFITIYI